MGSQDVRDAISGAIAYLTANPAEARYTDSAASATLEEGLRVRVTGPAGESLTTDMPTSVGGGAAAPSPGWFLRAAEASCVATLVAMRAAYLGVDLERLEVTVDSESDDRGILGADPGIPAGPFSTRVVVRIAAAGTNPADLESIAAWAVEHCPVTDAVKRAIPMTLSVEVTGD